MDYSKILQELENASLFDLYRMSSAINDELANSQRIDEIKQSLRVGQEVTWFDDETHRLERAVIEKCAPSRCEVKNLSDGKRWRVLYASINLNEVDATINSNQKFGVKKSALRVGDFISFLDNENKLQFAKVTKLNPKTVGVVTMGNVKWRVYYENLSKITDIDADVINKKELEYKQWLQNNQGLFQNKHPEILDNVVDNFLI